MEYYPESKKKIVERVGLFMSPGLSLEWLPHLLWSTKNIQKFATSVVQNEVKDMEDNWAELLELHSMFVGRVRGPGKVWVWGGRTQLPETEQC